MAEIVSILEYLKGKHVTHRDLKVPYRNNVVIKSFGDGRWTPEND